MPTFFHSWRRKVGCITLILACVLMCGWVRSYWVRDTLQLSATSTTAYFIHSNRAFLVWQAMYSTTPQIGLLSWHWYSDINLMNSFTGQSQVVRDDRVPVVRDWWGGSAKLTAWSLPYWSVVVPLTLVSAWLLLSKPRTAQPS